MSDVHHLGVISACRLSLSRLSVSRCTSVASPRGVGAAALRVRFSSSKRTRLLALLEWSSRAREKRPHQTIVQRLQRNDVLSVRKDDAADSYHVHVADGFPDHRKSVMPDFPI